jgi:putative phosphoesterase
LIGYKSTRVKIGLISDIHCNVEGLRAALDVLADCDEVVCAGDVMFQYRFSNELAALLESAGIRAVVGNHDKSILQLPNHPLRASPSVEPGRLAYLANLPEQLTFELAGMRILVAHGAPWDPPGAIEATYVYPHDTQRLGRMRHVEADVIVLGHTHVPMAERVANRLVINPGSCGVPTGARRELTCMSLDLATLEAELHAFASDAAQVSGRR